MIAERKTYQTWNLGLLCKFCKIFINTFFYRTPPVAASRCRNLCLFKDAWIYLLNIFQENLQTELKIDITLFLIKSLRVITKSFLKRSELEMDLNVFWMQRSSCVLRTRKHGGHLRYYAKYNYAKADIKASWSCPLLLDFFKAFRIFYCTNNEVFH